MKLRVVKCENLRYVTYYQVERKVLFWWRPIKFWYQPEIVGMPGWFSEQLESEEAAVYLMNSIKSGLNPRKIVRSKLVVAES
jgi:hypothetical protein